MIRDGKGFIPPGFQIYLMSMDTLKAYVAPIGDGAKAKTNKLYGMGTTSKLVYAVHPALKSSSVLSYW